MSILVSLSESILGEHRSRTPYEVLGLASDEQDPKAIEEAALRCASQVRAYQLTSELESALRLNEIARALITLLDLVCQREYDRGLGKLSSPAEDAVRTAEGDAFALHLGDQGACDVKLVYRRRALRAAGSSPAATGSTAWE